jgi:hypothetical protein
MSALGQKRTYAVQQVMSALPPIATAKADICPGPCPLYPRKRTLVSAFCGAPWRCPDRSFDAQDRAQPAIRLSRKDWLLRADRAVLSQVLGAGLRFGILPRRRLRRGGASVVAAMVAAQPKEIPMTKAKSKRKPASRTNNSRTKTRNSVKRTAAPTAVQLKSVSEPATQQRRPSVSQSTAGRESKKARIIAMLRAPGGVTIEAMARAAKWQPHSVRGFLAGVVRKKLGLNLISVAGDGGRVYRIADRIASAAA